MEIIYNSTYNIIEINNGPGVEPGTTLATSQGPQYGKIIKDLKNLKNEMCFRRETIYKDASTINNDFYLNKINKLVSNDDNMHFGFVIIQKVNLYGRFTERPVAVLIARKAQDTNNYIITLLCRHEKAQRGFGTLLIKKIIEKAKNNNIDKIFLESVNNASNFYEKMGFNFDEKSTITDSEKQIDCEGYSIDVKNIQIGGNNKKFLISNKKYNYLKENNNNSYYAYLYENDVIVSAFCFDKDIHISGKKMLLISDFKYDNINQIIELIVYLENVVIINDYSFIQFELSLEKEKNKELLTYLLSHNYKQVFKNSGIIRKYIK